jgi:hypothetical protein
MHKRRTPFFCIFGRQNIVMRKRSNAAPSEVMGDGRREGEGEGLGYFECETTS